MNNPQRQLDGLIELLNELEAVNKRYKPLALSRSDAIAVLEALQKFLRGATSTIESGPLSPVTISVEAPSSSILASLIDALKDLDHGIVNPCLEATPGLGGALLKSSEEELRSFAKFVFGAFRAKEDTSIREAATATEKLLKNIAANYRGRPITTKTVLNWRKNDRWEF